ncbi:hypothetical protein TELCIR_20885, partial [Teladorsagia circumcincta]
CLTNELRVFFIADTHLLGDQRGHWFDKLRRLNDTDCLRDEDFDEDDPNRNDPYRPKWEALSKESTELLLQELEPRA